MDDAKTRVRRDHRRDSTHCRLHLPVAMHHACGLARVNRGEVELGDLRVQLEAAVADQPEHLLTLRRDGAKLHGAANDHTIGGCDQPRLGQPDGDLLAVRAGGHQTRFGLPRGGLALLDDLRGDGTAAQQLGAAAEIRPSGLQRGLALRDGRIDLGQLGCEHGIVEPHEELTAANPVALVDSDVDDAQPADLGGNGKFLPGHHRAVAGNGSGHRPDLGGCDGHRQNRLLRHLS